MPPTREPFTFELDVNTASLAMPRKDVQACIDGRSLRVRVAGQDERTVELPDDAFTDDAHAHLSARKLCITIGRRDPQGPAMQEKALFNPDHHPVDIDVTMASELLKKGGVKPSPSHDADRTPAQVSSSENNPELGSEPQVAYKRPAVNMGSSIVTAMPAMVNAGGALDTVSKGETVTLVPGSSETHHRTGLDEASQTGELADHLRDTLVSDQAPPRANVLFGRKEAENEAAYDERAAQPHTGLTAGGQGGAQAGGGSSVTGFGSRPAGAPAGDEEHELAMGERGERVLSDFVATKVGMVAHELTAADMYVGSESKVEPISIMKTPGVSSCELCRCAPCQCGQMKHTGGSGNNPYELTAPETKRAGRPHIHSRHKEVTGVNSHDAHDYRGHAKQVNEGHAGIGARLSEYDGNVPEGMGDWSDPKYGQRQATFQGGATHTGGAPIEMGGPGKRQVSDAVGGGPTSGGSKTTIHTLG